MDGTLLDSNKEGSQCFGQAFQDTFGQPIPTMDWSQYPSVSDTIIFEAAYETTFGQKPTKEQTTQFEDNYNELLRIKLATYPERFKPVKGSKALTDYLLVHPDYVVGIATGGWKGSAVQKLEHIGIQYDKMFDAYADGHWERKNIVLESIEKATAIHEQFEKIVYVGDAKWDVITIRNLSLPLIGIRIKGDVDFLKKLGTQDVIMDYLDIEEFLDLVDKAVVPL